MRHLDGSGYHNRESRQAQLRHRDRLAEAFERLRNLKPHWSPRKLALTFRIARKVMR